MVLTNIPSSIIDSVLSTVTENGFELKWLGDSFQDNELIVEAAVLNSPWSFENASYRLRNSPQFVLKILHKLPLPDSTILIELSAYDVKSNFEVMSCALDLNNDGGVFSYAKGEVALNKELAAKALIKWGNATGKSNLNLWLNLLPTLQEFFPENSWYEKAQSYLNQLEQEKQAEMTSGGTKEEDGVVW